jgi:hypothetical protein
MRIMDQIDSERVIAVISGSHKPDHKEVSNPELLENLVLVVLEGLAAVDSEVSAPDM